MEVCAYNHWAFKTGKDKEFTWQESKYPTAVCRNLEIYKEHLDNEYTYLYCMSLKHTHTQSLLNF